MTDDPSHPKPAKPPELREKLSEAHAVEKGRPVSEVGADDRRQAEEDLSSEDEDD